MIIPIGVYSKKLGRGATASLRSLSAFVTSDSAARDESFGTIGNTKLATRTEQRTFLKNRFSIIFSYYFLKFF